MGERAQSLAQRFEQMNNQLIATVEQCTDAQWHARCPVEGWSVGVTAHHVGEAHPLLWGLTQGLADGEPLPPVTVEMNQQYTAHHAAQFADCNQAETVNVLQHNGEAVAHAIRQLSDEQLDQASPWTFAGGEVVSVQRMIEQFIIDHIHNHLTSINTVIGA